MCSFITERLLEAVFFSCIVRPNIWVYYIWSFLYYFSILGTSTVLITTLQDAFTEDDNQDNTKLSFAMAIMFGVGALLNFMTNPLWGDWGDIFGRRTVLVVTSTVLAGYPLLCLTFTGFRGALIATVVQGLFFPFEPINDAIIRDIVRDEASLSSYYAYSGIIRAVALFIELILFLVLLEEYSNEFKYLILMSVYGCSYIVLIFFVCETNPYVWIKMMGFSYHDLETTEGMEHVKRLKKSRGESKILEDGFINMSRNPIRLICGLRNESKLLRQLISCVLISAYQLASAGAMYLVYTEELYGWDNKRLVLVAMPLQIAIVFNSLLVSKYEQCFSRSTLLKLASLQILLQHTIRCFIRMGWEFFVASVAMNIPFTLVYNYELTTLIALNVDDRQKGRLFGAIDAGRSLIGAFGAIIPPLLFGYFISSHSPVYLPEIEILCEIPLVFWLLWQTWSATEELQRQKKAAHLYQKLLPAEDKEALSEKRSSISLTNTLTTIGSSDPTPASSEPTSGVTPGGPHPLPSAPPQEP